MPDKETIKKWIYDYWYKRYYYCWEVIKVVLFFAFNIICLYIINSIC